MELHAILEIGRHKSIGLESNLIGESIARVNATIGVLIRKRFQLINLESIIFSFERDNNMNQGFIRNKSSE